MAKNVRIQVEWTGKFKRKILKVPAVGANYRDTLIWNWKPKGSKDPLFILFPKESPFSEREYLSADGVITADVVYNPELGGAKVFKYVIGGCSGKNLHVLDPEIIIPKPGCPDK